MASGARSRRLRARKRAPRRRALRHANGERARERGARRFGGGPQNARPSHTSSSFSASAPAWPMLAGGATADPPAASGASARAPSAPAAWPPVGLAMHRPSVRHVARVLATMQGDERRGRFRPDPAFLETTQGGRIRPEWRKQVVQWVREVRAVPKPARVARATPAPQLDRDPPRGRPSSLSARTRPRRPIARASPRGPPRISFARCRSRGASGCTRTLISRRSPSLIAFCRGRASRRTSSKPPRSRASSSRPRSSRPPRSPWYDRETRGLEASGARRGPRARDRGRTGPRRGRCGGLDWLSCFSCRPQADLERLFHKVCTPEKVRAAELMIIMRLEWDTNVFTAYDAMDLLLALDESGDLFRDIRPKAHEILELALEGTRARGPARPQARRMKVDAPPQGPACGREGARGGESAVAPSRTTRFVMDIKRGHSSSVSPVAQSTRSSSGPRPWWPWPPSTWPSSSRASTRRTSTNSSCTRTFPSRCVARRAGTNAPTIFASARVRRRSNQDSPSHMYFRLHASTLAHRGGLDSLFSVLTRLGLCRWRRSRRRTTCCGR